MAVNIPFLRRELAGGCYRVCCGVAKPLVHVRSVHVAQPGSRSEEDLAWEAASFLPFSRAKIGNFFQERPVLKNPFLEDALLRGYLRRHLPKEVKRKPLNILYIMRQCWTFYNETVQTAQKNVPFSHYVLIDIKLGKSNLPCIALQIVL